MPPNSYHSAKAGLPAPGFGLILDHYVEQGCYVDNRIKIMSYIEIPGDTDLDAGNWRTINALSLEADMLRALLTGRPSWDTPFLDIRTPGSELTAVARALQQDLSLLMSALLRRSLQASLTARFSGVQSLKIFLQNRLESIVSERDFRIESEMAGSERIKHFRNNLPFVPLALPPVCSLIALESMQPCLTTGTLETLQS